MGKMIDLTGQRFGRLVVLKRAGSDNQNRATWLCRCDCGNNAVIIGKSLRSEATKSCGCLLREKVRERDIVRNTTHGKRHTRIYRIWVAMHERCNYPAAKSYANYGGRGIRVCREWGDFLSFYEWAIANGYRDDLTIDRIDNSGHYEPCNCRWTDAKQQSRNRRSNHLVTYMGQTKTLTEWAEQFQINRYTLYSRLKAGWSVEEALKTPVQFQNKLGR